MKEWSPAAQEGALKWLESATKEKPAVTELELWSVTKNKRTLRSVARYLPIARAKVQGKHLGRPRRNVSNEEIAALAHLPLRKPAAQLGVSKSFLQGWRLSRSLSANA